MTGYGAKNHLGLPAKFVVAVDKADALDLSSVKAAHDDWLELPWQEVQRQLKVEYQTKLDAWKAKKAKRALERDRWRAMGIYDALSSDEDAPMRPPLFKNTRIGDGTDGRVKHEKGWAPAPVGLPSERAERRAPPAYTTFNTKLLQMQHKVQLVMAKAEEVQQNLKDTPDLATLRADLDKFKAEVAASGRNVALLPKTDEARGRLRVLERAIEEREWAEKLVGEGYEAVLKRRRAEFWKVVKIESERMWQQEEEAFRDVLIKLKRKHRALPSIKLISSQLALAEQVSKTSPSTADVDRAKRVVAKHRGLLQEHATIDQAHADINFSIRERLGPFRKMVTDMAVSLGFPLVDTRGLQVFATDAGQPQPALKRVPKGIYQHHIQNVGLLGFKDENFVAADHPPRKNPIAWGAGGNMVRAEVFRGYAGPSGYKAGDLVRGGWDNRPELDRFTADLLGALGGESRKMDGWLKRSLLRGKENKDGDDPAVNSKAISEAASGVSVGLGGGALGGEGKTTAPIVAQDLFHELDAMLSDSSDDDDENDGGILDELAALQSRGAGSTSTTAPTTAPPAPETTKPVVRDGTLDEAWRAYVHWKRADGQSGKIWAERTTSGLASGSINYLTLGQLLGDMVPIPPSRTDLRLIGVLMAANGGATVSLDAFESAAPFLQIVDGRIVVPRGGSSGDDNVEIFLLNLARRVVDLGGVPELIRAFDEDGNGAVDPIELSLMLSAMLPGLRASERRNVLTFFLQGCFVGEQEQVTAPTFERLLKPYLEMVKNPAAAAHERTQQGYRRGRQLVVDFAAALNALGQRLLAKKGAHAQRGDDFATALVERFARSGTNKVTELELVELAKKSNMPTSDVADAAHQMWLLLDMDGDGAISAEEFRSGLAAVAKLSDHSEKEFILVRPVLQRLAAAVHASGLGLGRYAMQFDADKSGRLEITELITMVKSVMPQLKVHEAQALVLRMRTLDPSGDGRVDLNELRLALAPHMPTTLTAGAGAAKDATGKSTKSKSSSTSPSSSSFSLGSRPLLLLQVAAHLRGERVADAVRRADPQGEGMRFKAIKALICQAAQTVSAERGSTIEVADAVVAYLARALDVDGDGRVSLDEVEAALAVTIETTTTDAATTSASSSSPIQVQDKLLATLGRKLGDPTSALLALQHARSTSDGLSASDVIDLVRKSVPGVRSTELRQLLLLAAFQGDTDFHGYLSPALMLDLLAAHLADSPSDVRAAMGPPASTSHPTVNIDTLAGVVTRLPRDDGAYLRAVGLEAGVSGAAGEARIPRADVSRLLTKLVRQQEPGAVLPAGLVAALAAAADPSGRGATAADVIDTVARGREVAGWPKHQAVEAGPAVMALGAALVPAQSGSGSAARIGTAAAETAFDSFDREGQGELSALNWAHMLRFYLPDVADDHLREAVLRHAAGGSIKRSAYLEAIIKPHLGGEKVDVSAASVVVVATEKRSEVVETPVTATETPVAVPVVVSTTELVVEEAMEEMPPTALRMVEEEGSVEF